MKVINCFKKENNELLIELDNEGKILLQSLTDGVIRVRYTLKDSFCLNNGHMLIGPLKDGIDLNVIENTEIISVETKKIRLQIEKDTGAFTWYTTENELLVREPQRGGKWLDEIDVEGYDFEKGEQANLKLTGFSFNSTNRNAKRKFLRKAYSTKQEFVFSEDEKIFGLGQHEDGIINYRGHTQTLYQHNRKLPMPVVISSKGYAFFFNNSSFSAFHDDTHGSYFWSEVCEELDYFFIFGPEFDTIVSEIRNLTGKSAMLPLWVYGYWQSKEHYKTQQELINVAKEYRERAIPIDTIVQDWQYWPGVEWGEKRFDIDRYPDPEGMVKDLHDMNIKIIISIWTHFNNLGPNHKEMLDKDLLLANDCNIDMFKEQARQLHWKQVQEGLGIYNFDGWWCDGTEPFDGMRQTKFREEYFKRIGLDIEEYKRYLNPGAINLYPLLNSMAIYEGMRSEGEGKRVVNLTRACYPGQQRYGTVVWSGDIVANWEVLKRHIADGLNFCITGHSNWTFDIGGFFTKDRREECWWHAGDYTLGVEDDGYREFYVRSFQFGAFLPVFRSHGTDFSKEIWQFGQPGEIFYDTLVDINNLRYRLMPYIYSVAGMVTHKDYTMMRFLGFDFRKDPNVLEIADQYMFGPSIMVCPVTSPMYFDIGNKKLEGIEKSRKVYLPSGCNWYDFWTGEKFEGGQTIIAPAPLDKIPLYIKAGSILPLSQKIQYSGEIWETPWELRIYPGENGSFNIYEDSGDGYQYESNEFSWTNIVWDNDNSELTIMDCKDNFPELIKERLFNLVIVGKERGIGLEHEEKPDAVVNYTGEKIRIKKFE